METRSDSNIVFLDMGKVEYLRMIGRQKQNNINDLNCFK